METVFVARQPVLDKDLSRYGYELLFRSGLGNAASMGDGDSAISEIIMNTFSDATLDDLVGDSPVLINLSRRYLLKSAPLNLPSQRTTIQILDDIQLDEAALESVRELKSVGYAIGVDDFQYSRASDSLLDMIDVVKLEMPTLLSSEGAYLIERLRRFNVAVIAGNIEDYSQFERCRAIGCDYFQGFFLGRPNNRLNSDIPSDSKDSLALLGESHAASTDLKALETIISRDPSLSEKLLRYINSAMYHHAFEIRDLNQAIMMLGINELRRWISIAVLCDAPGKPDELITLLLIRARMAELLSLEMAPQQSDACFMAGLFSGLDAVFSAPMETVVDQLTLPQDIRDSLLYRTGSVGQVLLAVLAYEEGDPSGLHLPLLTAEQVRQRYIDSIHWHQQQRHHFQGTSNQSIRARS